MAARWMTEIYEPIMAMIPDDFRGKLEQAEMFHEILVHRWYLSQQADFEVNIFDAALDYINTQLPVRRDEAIASIADIPDDPAVEADVIPAARQTRAWEIA